MTVLVNTMKGHSIRPDYTIVGHSKSRVSFTFQHRPYRPYKKAVTKAVQKARKSQSNYYVDKNGKMIPLHGLRLWWSELKATFRHILFSLFWLRHRILQTAMPLTPKGVEWEASQEIDIKTVSPVGYDGQVIRDTTTGRLFWSNGTKFNPVTQEVYSLAAGDYQSIPGLTSNATAQVNIHQTDIVVVNAAPFRPGLGVRIRDGLGNTEPCNIASINYGTNTITMEVNFKATYLMANNPVLTSRDTAGIQEAVNALAPYGGAVEVPPGVTTVSDGIYITKIGVTIKGSGVGFHGTANSQIKLADGKTTEAMIWFDGRDFNYISGPLDHPYFGKVTDIFLYGNKAGLAACEGIRISHFSDIQILSTFILRCSSHGIRGYYPTADCDIYHLFVEQSWIEECDGNGVYFDITNADMTTRADGIFIRHNVFYYNLPIFFGCSVATATGKPLMFQSTEIGNNECRRQSIHLSGVDNAIVFGNIMNGDGGPAPYGILIDDYGTVRRSTDIQVFQNVIPATVSNPAIWLVGVVNYTTVMGNNVEAATHGGLDYSACTGVGNIYALNNGDIVTTVGKLVFPGGVSVDGITANQLLIAPATAFFKFTNSVAPGGGGIDHFGKTGFTTVTDAGAAGLAPLTYNPTTNQSALDGVATIGGKGGQSIDLQTADKTLLQGTTKMLLHSGTQILYGGYNGVAYVYFGAGNFSPVSSTNIDNGTTTERWRNGFYYQQVGIHNGTRFIHDIDATGHHSRDTSGNILTELTSGGIQHRTAGVLAGVAYTSVELTNQAAGNSATGYIYITSTGTNTAVGVVWPAAGTYLAAGAANGQVWVCVGVGGVAPGSLEKYISPKDGDIFFVYCKDPATRGHFVLLPEAGTGVPGQTTDSAVPVAGRTIGQVLITTGAPGLCLVAGMRTYA